MLIKQLGSSPDSRVRDLLMVAVWMRVTAVFEAGSLCNATGFS
jgi:hypothetical protein